MELRVDHDQFERFELTEHRNTDGSEALLKAYPHGGGAVYVWAPLSTAQRLVPSEPVQTPTDAQLDTYGTPTCLIKEIVTVDFEQQARLAAETWDE